MEINKGNYGIDTPERYKSYMDARGFGNMDAFLEYRKNWEEYPKQGYVSEYPLSLEFQISDVCNLKCPMCYRSQDDYVQGPDRFMDFDLFKKAIDEVAWKVPAIRFNSSGESVLHPQFLEMVKYAKDRGAIEVSIITNAGAIDSELFEKMLLAGVDWITVSVDGIREEYEKIRYPIKFDALYEKLKMMKEVKRRYFSPKPAINIQGIWPMIEKDIDEYIELMSAVSDYINYNTYINFDKLYGGDLKHIDPEITCAQPYQRLFILMNGDAYGCCGTGISGITGKPEIAGTLKNNTVYEIWHGDHLNNIRKLCSLPGRCMEIEMCRKCVIPYRMAEKIVKIRGRDCVVKPEYII